jgi:multimeric flavodoxin WrbA
MHVAQPIKPGMCKGIKVLGLSGSVRQREGMSKSERLLQRVLKSMEGLGVQTTFIRLADLKIHDCEGNYSESPAFCTYPCQSSIKYKDDEMQKVYDAVLENDVLILATPIRWNNHSAMVQKFIERMNCIENQDVWFGNRLIQDKVAGMIIIGHVDGVQHVGGNLMNFFTWLGFLMPQDAIASWVGPNDEDTTKDWDEIEANKFTQEDLGNMMNGVLRLAYELKQKK